MNDDLHPLLVFHRGEGVVDLGQGEVVGHQGRGAHGTFFQEPHGQLVMARHATVGTGHETLLVVDRVRQERHRTHVLAQSAEEIHVAPMRDHLDRLFVRFHRAAGGDHDVGSFAAGFLSAAGDYVFFFRRDVNVGAVLHGDLHPPGGCAGRKSPSWRP